MQSVKLHYVVLQQLLLGHTYSFMQCSWIFSVI